jgi:hypothetical protein
VIPSRDVHFIERFGRKRAPVADHLELDAIATKPLCEVDERRHLTKIHGLDDEIQPEIPNSIPEPQLGDESEPADQLVKRRAPSKDGIGFRCGCVGRNQDLIDHALKPKTLPQGGGQENTVRLQVDLETRVLEVAYPAQHILEMRAAEGVAAACQAHAPGPSHQRKEDAIGQGVQTLLLILSGDDEPGPTGRAGEIAGFVVRQHHPFWHGVECRCPGQREFPDFGIGHGIRGGQRPGCQLRAMTAAAVAVAAVVDRGPDVSRCIGIPDILGRLAVEVADRLGQPRRAAEIDIAAGRGLDGAKGRIAEPALKAWLCRAATPGLMQDGLCTQIVGGPGQRLRGPRLCHREIARLEGVERGQGPVERRRVATGDQIGPECRTGFWCLGARCTLGLGGGRLNALSRITVARIALGQSGGGRVLDPAQANGVPRCLKVSSRWCGLVHLVPPDLSVRPPSRYTLLHMRSIDRGCHCEGRRTRQPRDTRGGRPPHDRGQRMAADCRCTARGLHFMASDQDDPGARAGVPQAAGRGGGQPLPGPLARLFRARRGFGRRKEPRATNAATDTNVRLP